MEAQELDKQNIQRMKEMIKEIIEESNGELAGLPIFSEILFGGIDER